MIAIADEPYENEQKKPTNRMENDYYEKSI